MVKPKKEIKRNNHGTRKCKLNKQIAEIVVMPSKPNNSDAIDADNLSLFDSEISSLDSFNSPDLGNNDETDILNPVIPSSILTTQRLIPSAPPLEESVIPVNGDHKCNSSVCNQFGNRLANIEIQLEEMHSLNKELLKLLEASQEESASLREVIKTMTAANTAGTDVITALPVESPPVNMTVTPQEPPDIPTFRPIPKPRKHQVKNIKSKPNITVIGDSMLRGTGPTLAKKLTSWNTCVESKSGLNLNDATTSIPERVKGMDSSNSVVLHLGTNDIDLTNESDLAAKYSHLIRKIRTSAPDCSVVVTAVANQLHPGSVNTNQKIDTLNNSLRSTCNLDNKCHFVNCNPPVKESFYKRDGFHFNYKGSHFFADCLTRFFMNKSNFLKTPNPTYT